MKKTSKFKSKKYPRLKKYLYGDTVDGGLTPMTVPEDPSLRSYSAPAESAAVTQQKQQQAQLQAKNKKDSNNMGYVSAAAGTLGNYASIASNPNLNSAQKTNAYGNAVNQTADSIVGAIPGYGQAYTVVSGVKDAALDATTSSNINPETGEKSYKQGTDAAAAAAAKPLHTTQIDNWTKLAGGDTSFGTILGSVDPGLGKAYDIMDGAGWFGGKDKYAENEKLIASENQKAQEASNKRSQDQQNYINQQIQSGIQSYYENPDNNKNQSQTFAMGGIPQIPNSEVETDEFVTSETAPVAYEGGGFKMASNNPAPGGVPTYESVGRTHKNGGIIAKLEDGGEADPAVVNGKTRDFLFKKNILAGKKFADTMRNITNQERYNTKKLENGNKEAKASANLMLPILARAKEDANARQKIAIDANQAIKDAKKYRDYIYKNGTVPSMNNNQSQNGMVMAKYGAQMKYRMGGMQGLPKYDGGGYSDASGSYDSQGNMIAGPMGEILNDSQLSNMGNYLGNWGKEIEKEYQDAWDSGVDFDTRYDNRETQRRTPQDFIFNYKGSQFEPLQYKFYNINKTENSVSPTLPVASTQPAAIQPAASSPVINATPAILPAATPQSSIGDPSKGYYVNGVWNAYPTYARSTPEGTFNAAGEQTSDAYGRPMAQTFAPIQAIQTDPNNPKVVTNLTNKIQAEKDLQNSWNKDVAPRANGSMPAPDPKDYSNYADYARQAAIFAGQNLGNISDLIRTRGGKKYDKESYGQMTPQMPDFTEAKRNAKSEASAYRRMLPGLTGGNAGATLGMMGQMQGLSQQALAKIVEGEQQARAGVYNQFLPLNKQLQMQERADTQANKARSEDIARMATSGIAATIGGAGADYGMSKSDQEKLDLISKAYPDYNYDKRKKAWYHKNTNEKLDPTKVQAATTTGK